MKFLIRKAEMDDSESITELSNQLGYKSELIEVQKRLTEILKNNDNCVFMALEGEKIVGWGHGFYSRRIESDPFVEIGGLVVDIERMALENYWLKKSISGPPLRNVKKYG